ncbi:MAG TPA: hypothetical protein VLB44_04060 [Kofleriaceae bacterium]|nr:hypothetical protein [Kofleriaceae bacterium]
MAGALAGGACHSYEGSRTVAAVGGGTFATGFGVWVTTAGRDEAALPVAGAVFGAVGMMVMIAASVGMLTLPKEVELALRLAHELIVRAEEGDCATVAAREHEVEALDLAVYEVVLVEDPAVSKCLQP